MAATNGRGTAHPTIDIPPGGFAEPGQDEPGLFSAVGFVLLGVGCMGVFTIIGVVAGMAPISALVLAWVGSIAAVLTVAAVVVLREAARAEAAAPDIETIKKWEIDLEADISRMRQINDWDNDRLADRAEADHTGKRSA